MSAELLKMIEEVDPNDTAKLDEIDASVGELITGVFYIKEEEGKCVTDVTCAKTGKSLEFTHKPYPQYTRSRDALKAIRPEGWTFRNLYHYPKPDGEYGFVMTNNPLNLLKQYQVVGKSNQTEELAELHAIIQAIAWERDQQ